ncbi:MAG TPA: HAMP domain-containing sensor histidine kinase [Chitinophagaceae bacterium]|nr:HAMP domain-containing sensor histidine kinase [Chitinophagaceae bacterium]
MPIRYRIILLFTLLVLLILGIVCGSIYYFSASSRTKMMRTRLTNRAITTARLLKQSEVFDRQLVRRIDSSMSISLKDKSVQAYNAENKRIYNYTDAFGDTVHVSVALLNEARSKGNVFFREGQKEAVAFHTLHAQGTEKGLVIISAARDDEGNRNMSFLKQILIASFITGIGISFAGGYIFSGRLLRPVKKITEEVTDIYAYNLARRIPPGNTKDEWYKLTNTLNDLLDRLNQSFEMQRRFISNASHELSTPLTLISSQLEVSLQRNRNEEEYRRVMQAVLQDVHYMNNLVQTLLKFATASGNPGGLNIDLIRIDEVLMRIPASIQKQDAGFSVSLQFNDLPDEENKLLVFGNEELLFTAIRNVAVNACKYSPDHHAEIILTVLPEEFIIHIIDKGPGIPDSELENIFQPFYRIEETRSIAGFGLGLSLASRIIKLHKGDVQVESTPGVGTTFELHLPVAGKL